MSIVNFEHIIAASETYDIMLRVYDAVKLVKPPPPAPPTYTHTHTHTLNFFFLKLHVFSNYMITIDNYQHLHKVNLVEF